MFFIGKFRRIIMERYNTFEDMHGVTFNDTQFEIIYPFLKEVEGFKSFERNDVGHFKTYQYEFVRWSDILQIDKEKFQKCVHEWIDKFVALENEYEDVKLKYKDYLNKKIELSSGLF